MKRLTLFNLACLVSLPHLSMEVNANDFKLKTTNTYSSKGNNSNGFGLSYKISKETKLSANYSSSTDSGIKSSNYDAGIDYELNSSLSINGSALYSKDEQGLTGKGFLLGTDYTISDLWEAELTTTLNLEFSRTLYDNEVKLGTTLTTTDYSKSYITFGVDQEITDWLSANLAHKKYSFKENSTRKVGNAKAVSYSNSLELGEQDKNSIGMSLYKKNWPSFSTKTNYGDGTTETANNYSLSYKFSSFTIGASFTHSKNSVGTVEDSWSPRFSASF